MNVDERVIPCADLEKNTARQNDNNDRTNLQNTEDNFPDSVIWFEVEKIGNSQFFRQSTRMVRFLRHVVRAALAGSEGDLKETSIGVAVYDRDPGYDPKIDPVVRNEARRLRQKLEKYYKQEGVDADVLIEIPKGAYSPVFRSIEICNEPPSTGPVSESLDEESEEKEQMEAPVSSGADEQTVRWSKGRVFMVAILLALPLAYLLFLNARKHFHREPDIFTAVASTFTTWTERASQPALSFDEKRLVYASEHTKDGMQLFIQSKGTAPLQLTNGSRVHLLPAWSPDDSHIAFLSALGPETIVATMASTGGAPLKLFPLHSPLLTQLTSTVIENIGSPGPEWTRNGESLIVADEGAEEHSLALYQHDLQTGKVTTLTQPRGEEHDLWPKVSPDGDTLLFVRSTTNSSADLYLLSLRSGQLRQLTNEHSDIRGVSWLGSNDRIIFSSNRRGFYSLWILDLRDLSVRPLSAPGERNIEPSAGRSGGSLVYTDSSADTGTALVTIGGPGVGEMEPFAQVPGKTNSAQFSPDGTQVAFTSDRSGRWEVWIADATGANARQVTQFGGPMLGTIHWSPDGKNITFDARPDGVSSIFILPLSGAPMRKLGDGKSEEKQPFWSHDGRWIYFSSNRNGQPGLWRESPDGSREELICAMDVADPQETQDGLTVFFSARGKGIWQVPASGGKPNVIEDLKDIQPRRLWQITAAGIVFVDEEHDPGNVQIYNPVKRTFRSLVRLKTILAMDTPSLSVSPDGSKLLVANRENPLSRIVLLESGR